MLKSKQKIKKLTPRRLKKQNLLENHEKDMLDASLQNGREQDELRRLLLMETEEWQNNVIKEMRKELNTETNDVFKSIKKQHQAEIATVTNRLKNETQEAQKSLEKKISQDFEDKRIGETKKLHDVENSKEALLQVTNNFIVFPKKMVLFLYLSYTLKIPPYKYICIILYMNGKKSGFGG